MCPAERGAGAFAQKETALRAVSLCEAKFEASQIQL